VHSNGHIHGLVLLLGKVQVGVHQQPWGQWEFHKVERGLAGGVTDEVGAGWLAEE
jgi:hypothetical protein